MSVPARRGKLVWATTLVTGGGYLEGGYRSLSEPRLVLAVRVLPTV
jgi:hypothetical protein